MQVQKIELTGLGFGGDFAAEESYKTLLSNIQFCGGDVKLISITSCFPNEGKTTISIELSRELAEAGKKVLLIDADMWTRRVALCHEAKASWSESASFGSDIVDRGAVRDSVQGLFCDICG